jgi:hypothetical protein
MEILLEALCQIDEGYLRKYPDQFPPLYEAGIVYDRMTPPAGSACGDDDWQDLAVLYQMKKGDCEDLACARAAELRVRWGIPARPYVALQQVSRGGKTRHLYHIMVEWPEVLPGHLDGYPETVRRMSDGTLVECPSEVLGMKPEAA